MNYGALQPGGVLTALYPGDDYYPFKAESPTAPQASVAFAMGYNPGGGGNAAVVFQATWAATPTAVLTIQGSNTDVDSDYIALGTITAQGGFYADGGGFQFYRVVLTSQSAGGAITVRVKR